LSNAKRIVTAALESALAKVGFVRRSGLLVRPLSEGNIGTLGLTTTLRRDGPVGVLAVIWVRHSDVYNKGAELGAYPESKTNGTLAVPLEYLDPAGEAGNYQLDRTGIGNDAEIARLTEHVVRLAFPFYERLSTPELALEEIRTRGFKVLHHVPSFVPVAMLLSGDVVGALESAKTFLASMDVRRGTGKQYQQFVDKLTAATRH
jgi:hypothetical protein